MILKLTRRSSSSHSSREYLIFHQFQVRYSTITYSTQQSTSYVRQVDVIGS